VGKEASEKRFEPITCSLFGAKKVLTKLNVVGCVMIFGIGILEEFPSEASS
jgi:hypothetical protein